MDGLDILVTQIAATPPRPAAPLDHASYDLMAGWLIAAALVFALLAAVCGAADPQGPRR